MASLREHVRTTVEAQHQRSSTRKVVRRIAVSMGIYALLLLGVVLFTAPFAWMVSASLQSIGDMFAWPPRWIPRNATLDNYIRFFTGPQNIGRLFFNSAFVALSVTSLQIFLNSLAAYTFAKRRFPGRDALFLLLLGSMMIPGQVTMIPSYLIIKHIPLAGGNDIFGLGGSGWLDTYWALIVPGAASAFGIFLLRQYMKGIPDDLLDAARIDGGSEFLIYRKIVMPLSKPALAAMGIFTFNYVWEDFLWPLIVISSEEMRTLPLGLALFVVKNRTVWDLLMAGSVVATIPVLIVFLIFQRQFIQGIALSGLK